MVSRLSVNVSMVKSLINRNRIFFQTRILRYHWRLLQPIMSKMGIIFTWPWTALFESQLHTLRCLSKSIIVLLITLSIGQTTQPELICSTYKQDPKTQKCSFCMNIWITNPRTKLRTFDSHMYTHSYHSLPESQSEENVDLPKLHCFAYLCEFVVNIYRMARMSTLFWHIPISNIGLLILHTASIWFWMAS